MVYHLVGQFVPLESPLSSYEVLHDLEDWAAACHEECMDCSPSEYSGGDGGSGWWQGFLDWWGGLGWENDNPRTGDVVAAAWRTFVNWGKDFFSSDFEGDWDPGPSWLCKCCPPEAKATHCSGDEPRPDDTSTWTQEQLEACLEAAVEACDLGDSFCCPYVDDLETPRSYEGDDPDGGRGQEGDVARDGVRP